MDGQKKNRAKAGLLALKALNLAEAEYLDLALEALENDDQEDAAMFLDLCVNLDRSGMAALLSKDDRVN